MLTEYIHNRPQCFRVIALYRSRWQPARSRGRWEHARLGPGRSRLWGHVLLMNSLAQSVFVYTRVTLSSPRREPDATVPWVTQTAVASSRGGTGKRQPQAINKLFLGGVARWWVLLCILWLVLPLIVLNNRQVWSCIQFVSTLLHFLSCNKEIWRWQEVMGVETDIRNYFKIHCN